jgi:hypothetical protein
MCGCGRSIKHPQQLSHCHHPNHGFASCLLVHQCARARVPAAGVAYPSFCCCFCIYSVPQTLTATSTYRQHAELCVLSRMHRCAPGRVQLPALHPPHQFLLLFLIFPFPKLTTRSHMLPTCTGTSVSDAGCSRPGSTAGVATPRRFLLTLTFRSPNADRTPTCRQHAEPHCLGCTDAIRARFSRCHHRFCCCFVIYSVPERPRSHVI